MRTFFGSLAGRRNWWSAGLAMGVGLVCFGLALLPVHTVETTLTDYAPAGKLEQADGVPFFWTTPDVRLVYRDLPRFVPVVLKLSVQLARPPEAPPATLDILEARGNTLIPLAVIQYVPGKDGFEEYTVKIPAVAEGSSDE